MNPSLRQYRYAGMMLAVGTVFGMAGTTPALATVCPAIGADTDCGIIITLNPVGATVVATGQPPYDNIEDTLIGVINNTGHPVNGFTITGAVVSDIFGFDGDGLQTFNGNPTFGLPSGGARGYEGTVSATGMFDLSGPQMSFQNEALPCTDPVMWSSVLPGSAGGWAVASQHGGDGWG